MKSRRQIIALILCTVIYPTVRANDQVNFLAEQTEKLEFEKYYEPYVMDFEPNAPGYTLPLDINNIVNPDQFASVINKKSVSNMIKRNGFAIVESKANSLEDITLEYKSLSTRGIPVFITTDTVLHIYHIQFEQALREMEERQFISDIRNMTSSLLQYNIELYPQLEGDLKEATRRNIAYLAVAQKLLNLDPKSHVPELVEDIVTREVDKIEAHSDVTSSDIFIYNEDYTQYVPRSRYVLYFELRHYYMTMMWYGRMGFLLNGGQDFLISENDARIQTLQAFLLVWSMEKARVNEHTAFEIFERMHKVLSFFVGPPDDLTPYNYLSVLKKVLGENYDIEDISKPSVFQALKNELALLPSPKILSGIGDPSATTLQENLNKTKGMRLMSQRFVPDSFMFQNLVYPRVNRYKGDADVRPFTCGASGTRCYPRGLDLMALLGSSEARQILIDEGDANYVDYQKRWSELKKELDKLNQKNWNCNLYWSWLYTLKPLLKELSEGYPTFMRTSAWQRHQLNTALASWTELRHDTNLYAKMSGWPLGLMKWPNSSPPPPGYVEPVPQFYGRLLSLTRMTRNGLSGLEVLSEDVADRLKALENVLERLITISVKELANQNLSELEHAFIKDFSAQIAPTISEIPPTDLTAQLIVDIHTFGPEGLVVEEAVEGFDRIVVACSTPDGSIYLATGPVFSYYEFKQPMSNRLSDEMWQYSLLDSTSKPDRPKILERPKWYEQLIQGNTDDSL